jgi:hypothetical protein
MLAAFNCGFHDDFLSLGYGDCKECLTLKLTGVEGVRLSVLFGIFFWLPKMISNPI